MSVQVHLVEDAQVSILDSESGFKTIVYKRDMDQKNPLSMFDITFEEAKTANYFHRKFPDTMKKIVVEYRLEKGRKYVTVQFKNGRAATALLEEYDSGWFLAQCIMINDLTSVS